MTPQAPHDPESEPSPPVASDRADWIEMIEEIGEEAGYFEPLGARHWAFFRDESPVLLVTFETLDQIRANGPRQLPQGDAIAQARGWSHLCLIADGETWYRDAAVFGYFDRMVDDAFFEDFDRVVFYGAEMGGYAACAFAVTAPGATVLAVSPCATLDPAVAGWDRRHRALRRTDFRERYGYAPDMIEGTGEVFVLHDPAQTLDAMHASLFCRPNVTHLRCPNLGMQVEAGLTQMQVLPRLIDAAAEGLLTSALFARLWRERRSFQPYLMHLLNLNAASTARAMKICRSVNRRMKSRRFSRRMQELEARMQPTAANDPH